MTRRIPNRFPVGLVLTAGLVASFCALIASWSQRVVAAAAERSADAAYAMVLTQATRLEALRLTREVVDDRPRPRSEIIEPFKAQLHASGLRPEAMTQFTMPDAQPVPGTPFRRQQGSLTVDRVRLPDVVRLLAAWQENQPLWLVRSVRLERSAAVRPPPTPSGPPTLPGASGGGAGVSADDLFTAFITLENVYFAGSSPEAKP